MMVLRATPQEISEGGLILLETDPFDTSECYEYEWFVDDGFIQESLEEKKTCTSVHWDTTGLRAGAYKARVKSKRISVDTSSTRRRVSSANAAQEGTVTITVKARPLARGDLQPITLGRTAHVATDDVALWIVIKNSTDALSFRNYDRLMRLVLCGEELTAEEEDEGRVDPASINEVKNEFNERRKRRFLPYFDVDAYRLLKVATEAFVIANCGVKLDSFPFSPQDLRQVVDRTNITRRDNRPIDLNDLWKQYLETVNGT